MGILGRDSKKNGGNRAGTTVVAAGTHLVGTLELKDSFHLDGSMEGSISSEGDVAIGESGSFDGEINAKRVLVSGKFEGVLDAERLEIIASGRVSGEIAVRELVIEPGGQFSGTSHIKRGDEEPRRLTHIVPSAAVETNSSDDSVAQASGSNSEPQGSAGEVTPEQRVAAINRNMG